MIELWTINKSCSRKGNGHSVWHLKVTEMIWIGTSIFLVGTRTWDEVENCPKLAHMVWFDSQVSKLVVVLWRRGVIP